MPEITIEDEKIFSVLNNQKLEVHQLEIQELRYKALDIASRTKTEDPFGNTNNHTTESLIASAEIIFNFITKKS